MAKQLKTQDDAAESERRVYSAPALEKGLDILEMLCKSDRALSQKEIAKALGLQNVKATHARAEDIDQDFEFVVSRAVTRITPFYYWVRKKISPNHFHSMRNGILYLKGGDLREELEEFGKKHKVFDLSTYFDEDFFETKKVLYVPM